MAPDRKTNSSFDTASIATSSDSIQDDKERGQQPDQRKESLTRKVINGESRFESSSALTLSTKLVTQLLMTANSN